MPSDCAHQSGPHITGAFRNNSPAASSGKHPYSRLEGCGGKVFRMADILTGRPRVHHVTEKACAKCARVFRMDDVGIKYPSQFRDVKFCSIECRGKRLRPLRSPEQMKEFLEHNSRPSTSNDCRVWTASVSRRGYGRFENNGKFTAAHRAAYQVYKGEIPCGLVVMHKCDNPPCINPDHLTVGTQSDNMKDCAAKGRHNLQTHNRATQV